MSKNKEQYFLFVIFYFLSDPSQKRNLKIQNLNKTYKISKLQIFSKKFPVEFAQQKINGKITFSAKADSKIDIFLKILTVTISFFLQN
jgi:hypothetical protein